MTLGQRILSPQRIPFRHTPLMGSDGVEPSESKDNGFTDRPAPTYGITTLVNVSVKFYFIHLLMKRPRRSNLAFHFAQNECAILVFLYTVSLLSPCIYIPSEDGRGLRF